MSHPFARCSIVSLFTLLYDGEEQGYTLFTVTFPGDYAGRFCPRCQREQGDEVKEKKEGAKKQ